MWVWRGGNIEGFMCLITAKALCLRYSHTPLSRLSSEWRALVKNTNSTDSQKYTFSYNMFISTTLLFTTLANLTLPPSLSWSSVTVATFMPLPRPFNSHAYPTNSCSATGTVSFQLSRDSYIHIFSSGIPLGESSCSWLPLPWCPGWPWTWFSASWTSTVMWRLLRADGVYSS